MSDMKIGSSKHPLPISLPIQLAGHKGERIGTSIADELNVRAISIKHDEVLILIISVELLWLDKFHVEQIRNIITSNSSIHGTNILVSCTHTHSGPDTLDWYDFAAPVKK